MSTLRLLLLALLVYGACLPVSFAADASTHGYKLSDLAVESASPNVRRMVNWVIESNNNQSMPFLIVDKLQARVFVFREDGQLQGASAALIGLAPGDESVPGIGDRKLESIRPGERTTPAGRFVAMPGRNLQGQEMVWVDYEAGISLHRVIAGTPKEQRAKRLASPTPLDNRITYGCINVPASFFDKVVMPSVRPAGGIVYVLPDTKSLGQVFGVDGMK